MKDYGLSGWDFKCPNHQPGGKNEFGTCLLNGGKCTYFKPEDSVEKDNPKDCYLCKEAFDRWLLNDLGRYKDFREEGQGLFD